MVYMPTTKLSVLSIRMTPELRKRVGTAAARTGLTGLCVVNTRVVNTDLMAVPCHQSKAIQMIAIEIECANNTLGQVVQI